MSALGRFCARLCCVRPTDSPEPPVVVHALAIAAPRAPRVPATTLFECPDLRIHVAGFLDLRAVARVANVSRGLRRLPTARIPMAPENFSPVAMNLMQALKCLRDANSVGSLPDLRNAMKPFARGVSAAEAIEPLIHEALACLPRDELAKVADTHEIVLSLIRGLNARANALDAAAEETRRELAACAHAYRFIREDSHRMLGRELPQLPASYPFDGYANVAVTRAFAGAI